MAHEHPEAEIVGICDEQPGRMLEAAAALGLAEDQLFTDYRACLEKTKPHLAILCPAAAAHGLWTRRVAEYAVHVMVEKPFAATLTEADEMLHAMAPTGKLLAINWPLRWMPASATAKRLIDEGAIGEVLEVHHYGGNRGPLYHGAGKTERVPTTEEKAQSWFYQRALGGGSLLDYLGYGTTLGTWYMGGRRPLEVTCVTAGAPGLEVDEHSVTIARYETGLSKFETRWGTFTDPWTSQPQPKCGFVIVGSAGTLGVEDYSKSVRLQTTADPEGTDRPVDVLEPPFQNPIQYLLHCLDTGSDLEGPLSPKISRIGQQIVDSALQSASLGKTVPLVGG